MAKNKSGAGKTGRGGKKLNAGEALADAAAAQSESAANSTLLMPPTKTVQQLAKSKRNTKERLGEISGEHASEVKAAADKKHLDKKAFAMACSLDALSDQKLQVTYLHLLRYMDDLGVPKRATAQTQMFEETTDDDDDAGVDDTPGQEQGHRSGLRVVPTEGRHAAAAAGEK